MKRKLILFQFKCRTVNVEHSCRHGNGKEPNHPQELLECINSIVKATEVMQFLGKVDGPQNNYQIDYDFDLSWIKAVKSKGWVPEGLKKLKNITNIKPDAILFKDNLKVTVEIEKANKKTIWFDLMKIMMLVGQGVVNFGILIVPRNYAHKLGVSDLFKEARYYRWYLKQYAKVNNNLISKIAIIGYTQEVHIYCNWVHVDRSVVKSIKEQALGPL